MRMTRTIEIASPPALVWTWLDDPEKLKRWMKGVVADEPTSEGPTRVGSTFRMTIKEGRRLSEYDGEVLAYEPHRHMRVRLTGGCLGKGASMTADYRLTETAGGGTRLDYECTGELTGAMKLLAPVMKLFAGLQLRGFLRTLRALAEEEASRGVTA